MILLPNISNEITQLKKLIILDWIVNKCNESVDEDDNDAEDLLEELKLKIIKTLPGFNAKRWDAFEENEDDIGEDKYEKEWEWYCELHTKAKKIIVEQLK